MAAEGEEEEQEQQLRLVDFDCSCVAAAIFDLASAFVLDHSGLFRPFLAGYLNELGEAWSGADLEAVRLDAALASRRIQSGLEAIRLALTEATASSTRGLAMHRRTEHWLFGGGGGGGGNGAVEDKTEEETVTKWWWPKLMRWQRPRRPRPRPKRLKRPRRRRLRRRQQLKQWR